MSWLAEPTSWSNSKIWFYTNSLKFNFKDFLSLSIYQKGEPKFPQDQCKRVNCDQRRHIMEIKNSTLEDIDEIFRLYDLASELQSTKPNVVIWPKFDRNMVITEIEEDNQWKVIIDGKIACIWATTFEDEQIWEEKNEEPAVYLHRIAVNPEFRGNKFVKVILEWAQAFALEQGLKFVRLDTIGPNPDLIKYYQKSGFKYLGEIQLKNILGLPAHYASGKACLFEIALDDMD
ncbi:MAG: RimJ/RimL family protein N-acetyltransferase [Arcticibacterium sp.]|jgi:RimJ/RimL family protein N-acetyltransferase